jgi:AraC family transcriptional regulator
MSSTDSRNYRSLSAGEFFGATRPSRSVGRYRFTESEYAQGARLPIHAHECGHFTLVLSGHYEETIGSRVYGREPASLLFLPGTVAHGERHLHAGRHFMIEPPPEMIDRLAECGASLREPLTIEALEIAGLARRIYAECRNTDDVSDLAIEALCLQLLVQVRRMDVPKSRRRPRHVEEVVDILRARYMEPLTIEALAREVGIPATHLAHSFRRWMGCTIGDFVRRLRLDFACRELLRPDVTLGDLALTAGFYDQSHFNRAFRKHVQMTPSEYRRRALKAPMSDASEVCG